MFDGKAYGEGIVELVRGYVEREVAPLKAENEDLKARLAVLEAREPEKGEKGEPGDKGEAGQDGAAGKDGSDGRGIKALLIDRTGNLIASMDDGTIDRLGEVVGKDGEAGKDGADGFKLEDFDACVLEDDRTIQLSFQSGEHEHIATLKWPTVIYRDVFKEGTEYERGDVVTWAGSQWHCNAPTTDKPGTENWTLCVKKGRDGKDAKNG